MIVLSAFSPLSPQALAISNLFVAILVIMAAIFALVTGILLYVVVRYRARPGQGEPRQNLGNTRLEVTWTVAPILLLVVVFFFTVGAMRAADPGGDQRHPDLVVIGHQWWWEVRYPATGVVTANEIHLPVGRRLFVRLDSGDVIHNLWFPELGPKMDLVPGQTNYISLQADRVGVYQGACAEFCGVEHAWMRLRAIAQPPDQFAAWQRDQLQRAAAPPAGGQAARGAALFAQLTCISCHAISGVGGPTEGIAPNLTHVGSRQTLAAGLLANTAASMALWLRDPQAAMPGNHMPNLQLSGAQVGALTAYLEGLR